MKKVVSSLLVAGAVAGVMVTASEPDSPKLLLETGKQVTVDGQRRVILHLRNIPPGEVDKWGERGYWSAEFETLKDGKWVNPQEEPYSCPMRFSSPLPPESQDVELPVVFGLQLGWHRIRLWVRLVGKEPIVLYSEPILLRRK
jgi:hypothetical protein